MATTPATRLSEAAHAVDRTASLSVKRETTTLNRAVATPRLTENVSTAQGFYRETVAVWQRLSERNLSMEDGREITGNVVGFFTTLARWSSSPSNQQHGKESKRREAKE